MKLIQTEDIDFYYVDTIEDLAEVTLLAEQQQFIGTDTETYVDLTKQASSALDAHSSLISLIQLNWPGNDKPYLIDVISIGVENCMDLIERVYMQEDICKIFHNASFDIKQFRRTFGVWIKNVQCTMTLLKSLGICTGYKASQFRGHRLIDMCRDLFGVMLDKTEAKSQWGARPLTDAQLSYAALDVGAFKSSSVESYLLEAFFNITEALEDLNQGIAYQADQQAVYISAKLEFEGMYVNTNVLNKAHAYAEELTNKHRQDLVEELGFTVYNDLDITDDGEWVQVQVIPDKIKKLLNNNKALVEYVNGYMEQVGGDMLSTLQAEEVKNYLDDLEKEVSEDEAKQFDEDYFNSRYNSINLIKNLLNYKKYSKLLSECEKYQTIINPNTGKVHAGFNAVGTSTGRMSSSGKLNLQQVSNTQVSIELEKELM